MDDNESSDFENNEIDHENYKGIYYKDNAEKFIDPQTGAHFDYLDLYGRLLKVAKNNKIFSNINLQSNPLRNSNEVVNKCNFQLFGSFDTKKTMDLGLIDSEKFKLSNNNNNNNKGKIRDSLRSIIFDKQRIFFPNSNVQNQISKVKSLINCKKGSNPQKEIIEAIIKTKEIDKNNNNNSNSIHLNQVNLITKAQISNTNLKNNKYQKNQNELNNQNIKKINGLQKIPQIQNFQINNEKNLVYIKGFKNEIKKNNNEKMKIGRNSKNLIPQLEPSFNPNSNANLNLISMPEDNPLIRKTITNLKILWNKNNESIKIKNDPIRIEQNFNSKNVYENKNADSTNLIKPNNKNDPKMFINNLNREVIVKNSPELLKFQNQERISMNTINTNKKSRNFESINSKIFKTDNKKMLSQLFQIKSISVVKNSHLPEKLKQNNAFISDLISKDVSDQNHNSCQKSNNHKQMNNMEQCEKLIKVSRNWDKKFSKTNLFKTEDQI